MLDLIGNIRIKETEQESIEERINYLLMVIDSFSYLSEKSKFYLNVENSKYIDTIKENLIKNNFVFNLTNERKYFDEIYMEFVKESDKNYFQHFEEDHISICNDINYINYILEKSEKYDVDLIKSTFFQVELDDHTNTKPIYENDLCKIIRMNPLNHNIVNKKWKRYYIGNNCIFNKGFAMKYWGRKLKSFSPHKHEIPKYDKKYEHTLMVTKKELLCSINDDHGLPNTCYLKRNINIK